MARQTRRAPQAEKPKAAKPTPPPPVADPPLVLAVDENAAITEIAGGPLEAPVATAAPVEKAPQAEKPKAAKWADEGTPLPFFPGEEVMAAVREADHSTVVVTTHGRRLVVNLEGEITVEIGQKLPEAADGPTA